MYLFFICVFYLLHSLGSKAEEAKVKDGMNKAVKENSTPEEHPLVENSILTGIVILLYIVLRLNYTRQKCSLHLILILLCALP